MFTLLNKNFKNYFLGNFYGLGLMAYSNSELLQKLCIRLDDSLDGEVANRSVTACTGLHNRKTRRNAHVSEVTDRNGNGGRAGRDTQTTMLLSLLIPTRISQASAECFRAVASHRRRWNNNINTDLKELGWAVCIFFIWLKSGLFWTE